MNRCDEKDENVVKCLNEDVLLKVFQYLNEKDLENCENVCDQWKNLLLAGLPWKRLCHRKAEMSLTWRNALKNAKPTTTREFRSICLDMFSEIRRNWCDGSFMKSVLSTNGRIYHVDFFEDKLIWNIYRNDRRTRPTRGFQFLDTESLEISEMSSVPYLEITNEDGDIFWPYNNLGNLKVEIHLPNRKIQMQILNDEAKGFRFRKVLFTGEQLVCLSINMHGTRRLRIWKVGNPCILLHDKSGEMEWSPINTTGSNVAADDLFIVESVQVDCIRHSFRFTPINTPEQYRALSARTLNFNYHRGLLFLENGRTIQMLDVASGIFLNELLLPLPTYDHSKRLTCSYWNSSVIVIELMMFENESSHLICFFDWEQKYQPKKCIFELKTTENTLMKALDETRIVFITSPDPARRDEDEITILDASPSETVYRYPHENIRIYSKPSYF